MREANLERYCSDHPHVPLYGESCPVCNTALCNRALLAKREALRVVEQTRDGREARRGAAGPAK